MHDGKRLKQILEDLGMKKTELAKKLGVSSQNIYTYIKSKNINSDRKKEIEKILRLKFNEEDKTEHYKNKYNELAGKYIELLQENELLKEQLKEK